MPFNDSCLLNKKRGCTFDFTINQCNIGNGDKFVISEAGTYGLSEDVEFSKGFAIVIATSNVTLNLCGHTISGLGDNPSSTSVSGVYINGIDYPGISNVTVRNGRIILLRGEVGGVNPPTGGVTIARAKCVLVENVQSNDSRGIPTISPRDPLRTIVRGFSAYETEGVTFRRCEANRLTVTGPEDGSFSDGRGFQATTVESLTIDDCDSYQSYLGANLAGDTTNPGSGVVGVTIQNSRFSNNTLGGIAVINGKGVVIRDCEANNNGIVVGGVSRGVGIVVVFSLLDCHIQGCTVNENLACGGIISLFASNLVIEDCTTNHNELAGIGSLAGSNIVIRNCTSQGNDCFGFATLSEVSKITAENLITQSNGINQFHSGTSDMVIKGGCISTGMDLFGIGGGFLADSSERLTVDHVTVSGNVGSGVSLFGGSSHLIKDTLINNTQGPAIVNLSSNLVDKDNTLVNNNLPAAAVAAVAAASEEEELSQEDKLQKLRDRIAEEKARIEKEFGSPRLL